MTKLREQDQQEGKKLQERYAKQLEDIKRNQTGEVQRQLKELEDAKLAEERKNQQYEMEIEAQRDMLKAMRDKQEREAAEKRDKEKQEAENKKRQEEQALKRK